MKETFSVIAYLGLGSNQGDSPSLLAGARSALQDSGHVRLRGSSPLYMTEPVGGPRGQRDYLNAVLKVETAWSPRQLLEACHSIEDRFGRKRSELWGPRTLDIDVLFYGDRALSEEGLEVPHPRLHERLFVLAPLRDLAPGLIHPLLQKTIAQLHDDLPHSRTIIRLSGTW